VSKVDALRAMREARYARDSASGPTRREAAAAASGGVPVAPRAKVSPAKATESARTDSLATPEGERCGHKSMNGRACTRDAGHSEKNHRYS
jgi:hypothetical protein